MERRIVNTLRTKRPRSFVLTNVHQNRWKTINRRAQARTPRIYIEKGERTAHIESPTEMERHTSVAEQASSTAAGYTYRVIPAILFPKNAAFPFDALKECAWLSPHVYVCMYMCVQRVSHGLQRNLERAWSDVSCTRHSSNNDPFPRRLIYTRLSYTRARAYNMWACVQSYGSRAHAQSELSRVDCADFGNQFLIFEGRGKGGGFTTVGRDRKMELLKWR